jgi:Family of unknown function (DUF5990)
MSTAQTKPIIIRLVCKSMPTIPTTEGELEVGIQDKAQNIHLGRVAKDGSIYFECSIDVRTDTTPLDFRGPFVHGTPQSRFVYLSWKRAIGGAAPWYWRVKIPLAGISQKAVASLKATEVLVADITGRRPRASEPIVWNSGTVNSV